MSKSALQAKMNVLQNESRIYGLHDCTVFVIYCSSKLHVFEWSFDAQEMTGTVLQVRYPKRMCDNTRIVAFTHRDDSGALKRDLVAVQLNDDGVHTSIWIPWITLR